jgi:carbonic anhydrase
LRPVLNIGKKEKNKGLKKCLTLEIIKFTVQFNTLKMKIYSIGLLLLSMVVTSCNDALQQTPTLSNIDKLTSGNERFLNNRSVHLHQDKAAVIANEKAQHPFAVIITCADSRVSPEIVFDQGIGDLFVIRNAGNLMSDFAMGSVEYAVEHLNTKLVVVLGHTECGAIKAFVEDEESTEKHPAHGHISTIIETIKKEDEEKNVPRPHKEHLNECVIANIKHSTHQILANAFIDQKEIQVVPMLYDIHTGRVSLIK